MAEHSYDTPTPTKDRPKAGPADERAFPNIQSGRYKFISVIGQGGAGTVFLALDTILNKEVAIKKLHSASTEQAIRFQREAKLAGALNHENVLNALDFGVTEENQPYLILNYEYGESLASYTKRIGRLPVVDALNIAIQIASGLQHAHKNGVIHRDIKPSNVILVDKDRSAVTLKHLQINGTERESAPRVQGNRIAKIVDFGLAKSVHEVQEVTQIGTGLGTLKYMSPEQVHGIEVDERSDIYSFGCLMFEILTGHVPFRGNTALETLDMHLNMPPPPMACSEIECSENLDRIISRCLSKDPADRFQTAGDLLVKLRAELDDVEKRNVAQRALPATAAEDDSANGSQIHKKSNRYLLILGALSATMILSVVLLAHMNESFEPKAPTRVKKQKLYGEGIYGDTDTGDKISEEVGMISDGYRFRTSHAIDSDLKTFLNTGNNSKRMESIDLSDSNFTTAGYKLLADKTKVSKLSFAMRPITKHDLKNIALIPTLVDLRFGGGSKRIEPGAMIELAKLKKLDTLFVGQMQLDEKFFEDISQFKKLKVLQLTGCTGITSRGLSQLINLPDLEQLKLENSDITDGALIRLISAPTRISKLVLRGTQVTDRSINALAKMRTLQEVDLSGCTGVTPAGLERLKNRPKNSGKLSVEGGQHKVIQIEGLDKYDPDLGLSDY